MNEIEGELCMIVTPSWVTMLNAAIFGIPAIIAMLYRDPKLLIILPVAYTFVKKLFGMIYVFEDGILCKRILREDIFMTFEALKKEGVCLYYPGKGLNSSIKICLGNKVLLEVDTSFKKYDEFLTCLNKKRLLTSSSFGKPMVQKEWAEKNRNRYNDD